MLVCYGKTQMLSFKVTFLNFKEDKLNGTKMLVRCPERHIFKSIFTLTWYLKNVTHVMRLC